MYYPTETIELRFLPTDETIQVGSETAAKVLTRNPDQYKVLTREKGFRAQADSLANTSQPDLTSLAQDLVDSAG